MPEVYNSKDSLVKEADNGRNIFLIFSETQRGNQTLLFLHHSVRQHRFLSLLEHQNGWRNQKHNAD
jgi:hypothetical protein